mmetsp:Transcript_33314/g.88551  ORF Transcript_33314/g.88551 Transcript_33314/m.88551 type:complete len:225 (-) Transcript_33314:36-710(-)
MSLSSPELPLKATNGTLRVQGTAKYLCCVKRSMSDLQTTRRAGLAIALKSISLWCTADCAKARPGCFWQCSTKASNSAPGSKSEEGHRVLNSTCRKVSKPARASSASWPYDSSTCPKRSKLAKASDCWNSLLCARLARCSFTRTLETSLLLHALSPKLDRRRRCFRCNARRKNCWMRCPTKSLRAASRRMMAGSTKLSMAVSPAFCGRRPIGSAGAAAMPAGAL